jgi:hypothetical protein
MQEDKSFVLISCVINILKVIDFFSINKIYLIFGKTIIVIFSLLCMLKNVRKQLILKRFERTQDKFDCSQTKMLVYSNNNFDLFTSF